MSVLLLFGAGASHGSLGVNRQPPLTPDLFNVLRNDFPATWGKISGELFDTFNDTRNFETGMEALEEADNGQLYPSLKDMAPLFCRYQIQYPQINLYRKLFSKFKYHINKGNIILSTLNYECLIEHALGFSGFLNMDYLNKYPLLLKPHGSCNFILQGFWVNDTNLTVMMKHSTIIGPLKIVHNDEVENNLSSSLLPAMCLYTKDKPNYIAPDFIKSILYKFQKYIESVDAIISIGVRPNQTDAHIWDSISISRADLYLVTAYDHYKSWTSENPRTNVKYIGDQFESSFIDICRTIHQYV